VIVTLTDTDRAALTLAIELSLRAARSSLQSQGRLPRLFSCFMLWMMLALAQENAGIDFDQSRFSACVAAILGGDGNVHERIACLLAEGVRSSERK
jgi:hypothetical protein